MFERFTERARRVAVLAQDEAVRRHHCHIGTGHLLLGLTYDGGCLAAMILDRLGVPLLTLRQLASDVIGRDLNGRDLRPSFTAGAKNAFELSLREALRSGVNFVGTEHLLLGLIREGDGVTPQILRAFGIEAACVRAEIRLVRGNGVSRRAAGSIQVADPTRRRR